MDSGCLNNPKLRSDSQDSDDNKPLSISGTKEEVKLLSKDGKPDKKVALTTKGVEQAKKRLRAFSIQKKSSLSPVPTPKPVSTGSATVFIGKATGVKTIPKPAEPDLAADPKKLPKPPKPGAKQPQDSYINTQKKTLAEIEDMKRKMELVELGIPLGLICPAPNSDKAMPTKAMPPIKTFLDSDKVDELIREAKKARAEGKEFKFDYRKLLPDYANPFQRKKDSQEPPADLPKLFEQGRKSRERDKRRSEKVYDIKRHTYKSDRHRDDKYRDKPKESDETPREREKSKESDGRSKNRDSKCKEKDEVSTDRESKSKERDKRIKEQGDKYKDLKNEATKDSAKEETEAEVNLKDFVVCDSWSDNEDKSKDSTPKPEEVTKIQKTPVLYPTQPDLVTIDPMQQLRESLGKKDKPVASPKPKLKRLNPVIDSFKFEIEEDDDDELDMFDEKTDIEKFSKVKPKKEPEESPLVFDFDDAKEETFEGMADDTFLESVINEIKQEEIDETSQDKGLVEYDESPSKDGDIRGSVTPEMDEKVRLLHSSRSDYSDGYKSTESGYKSTDNLTISEYKSDSDLERIVEERKRELERIEAGRKIAKYTADSLETWSFVLKICQPLLFRHDRNKCYKETRFAPKLWYTENPKLCNCVKDRQVVYEELEMCKMELVHNIYSAKHLPGAVVAKAREWYPRQQQWLTGASTVLASSEWEVEDSQPPATPEPTGDISLDKEYQRFMQAVWPEVAETKSETPRSTPVRREASKKKAGDDLQPDKKTKKMKMSSEGWSQESDIEEEVEKSYNALQDFLYEALHYNPSPETAAKKVKVEKEKRKRKHSPSTSVTDSSESEPKKRKKTSKKKDNKKSKSKDGKRRRVSKKNVKKLKEKQKKKKKIVEVVEDSDAQDLEKEKKKKDKKLKKKKLLKQKKKNQKKKKAKAKSSSSSDSSSDSEPEPEKKSKKKKKSSEKKKKNKKSESQEELFDVNILKNIKTERDSDDEVSKQLEFSPRRQKRDPREIINVKELQSDFVGNSIQIKKEVEEEDRRKEESANVAPVENQAEESREFRPDNVVEEKVAQPDFKEQEESQSTPLQLRPEEANNSQCSSQESVYSLKDQPVYEKDESHLRPSSCDNSNYSFHDVMASDMFKHKQSLEQETSQSHEYETSHQHQVQEHRHDMIREYEMQNELVLRSREREMQSHKQEMQGHMHEMPSREHEVQSHEIEIRDRRHEMPTQGHEVQGRGHEIQSRGHEHEIQSRAHEMQSREHDIQGHGHEMQSHGHDMEGQEYEQGNYEMYEQMAMAYQSDVASQHTSPPDGSSERRIETVVRARTCGEIKCDWRAGDSGAPPAPPAPPHRPSRWGLKPGEVNIVLTGGADQYPAPAPPPAEPVYKIQSIANRTDNSATGYDEAYMDMYGASDKLQYGDCFSTDKGDSERRTITSLTSSLDDRINLALRTTVLGEVAKDTDQTEDKDGPDKGILVTKSLSVESRAAKRVSFADGYKPGQDSDVEEPPVKKKKKSRRLGCPWPCPAGHPDHVPLWDALPPPPPPPGSPPPPAPATPPPAHLLRQGRTTMPGLLPPPHHMHKFDPNQMPAFMPPEPPPGLISFQNM